MATRSWFDSDKLQPGERLLRSAPARIRTEAPPHWWVGELVLTSDRLFFLPSVDAPFLDDVAFWLADIARGAALRQPAAGRRRRRRARVRLTATQPVALVARAPLGARPRARAVARPRPEEGDCRRMKFAWQHSFS
jgi:hypothetical protein